MSDFFASEEYRKNICTLHKWFPIYFINDYYTKNKGVEFLIDYGILVYPFNEILTNWFMDNDTKIFSLSYLFFKFTYCDQDHLKSQIEKIEYFRNQIKEGRK